MQTALITVESPVNGGYRVVLSTLDCELRWNAIETSTLPHPLPPELTDATTDHARLAERLGELLVDERIGRRLRELRSSSNAGVRLMLHLEDRELARLPWESMRCGTHRLFTDTTHPWTRVHQPERAAREAALGPDVDCWPTLRVLIAIGADESEEQQIRAQAELAAIEAALVRYSGFVDLEVLVRPPHSLLRDRCRELRPHILHFIGHASMNAADETVLEFGRDDAGGETWEWEAGDMDFDLQDAPPRFVFLNACSTDASHDDGGPWHLVDALQRLSVPAILTMRGQIDGAAAAAFAGVVYGELMTGKLLNVAVAEARGRLIAERLCDIRDAWFPSLTLAALPDRVLPRRFGVAPDRLDSIRNVFPHVHAFVDRREDRRKLMRELGEGPGAGAGHSLVAVLGDRLFGKTELVRWCLGTLALRGRNVAYVDLNERWHYDWLGLLGMIAEALASTGAHADANRAALDALYFEEIDAKGLAVAPPGAAEGSYERVFVPGGQGAVTTVFGLFHAALAEAAGDGRIVIALDHLPQQTESANWTTYVREHFVKTIAAGTTPVQLLLATDRPTLTKLTGSDHDLEQRTRRLLLEHYREDRYAELTTQFLDARGYEPALVRELLSGHHQVHSGPWTAEHLVGLELSARVEWQEASSW